MRFGVFAFHSFLVPPAIFTKAKSLENRVFILEPFPRFHPSIFRKQRIVARQSTGRCFVPSFAEQEHIGTYLQRRHRFDFGIEAEILRIEGKIRKLSVSVLGHKTVLPLGAKYQRVMEIR